tara:strand:+ start:173 stop:652 length:480 start_codon:yes stop_codon:yes gene_type:complete
MDEISAIKVAAFDAGQIDRGPVLSAKCAHHHRIQVNCSAGDARVTPIVRRMAFASTVHVNPATRPPMTAAVGYAPNVIRRRSNAFNVYPMRTVEIQVSMTHVLTTTAKLAETGRPTTRVAAVSESAKMTWPVCSKSAAHADSALVKARFALRQPHIAIG